MIKHKILKVISYFKIPYLIYLFLLGKYECIHPGQSYNLQYEDSQTSAPNLFVVGSWTQTWPLGAGHSWMSLCHQYQPILHFTAFCLFTSYLSPHNLNHSSSLSPL